MNRREALRTLAAGGATGALAAGAIVATVPAEAVALTPIEEMVGQLRIMFDTPDAETEEECAAHYEVFRALQTRIVTATPQTARDVALQFMADTHWGDTGIGDEFSDNLRALAGMPTTGETFDISLEGGTDPDPLGELVGDYERGLAAFNASEPAKSREDELIQQANTWEPHYDRLCISPPAATTLAGALAAIRLVIHEEETCGPDEAFTTNTLRAALAYFDGRA